MRLDFYFPGFRKKPPTPSVIPVTIAGGTHLFPFRTQQLSLPAPMVLPGFPVGESVVAGMTLGVGRGRHRLLTLDADAACRLPYPGMGA